VKLKTSTVACESGDNGICDLGKIQSGKYVAIIQAPSTFRYILPSVSEIKAIEDGLSFDVKEDGQIALPIAEGFLTLPFDSSTVFNKPFASDIMPPFGMASVFDLDPSQGSVVAYKAEIKSNIGDTRAPWVVDGHTGIDFVLPEGTKIRAAMPGTVTYVGKDDYGGLGIWLCYGSWANYYNHNSSILVKVNQKVTRGEVIALSGNTGQSGEPHLHFALTTCSTPPRSYDVVNGQNVAYDPFATENDKAPYKSVGYWTARNSPKFPL
jgi:murein DD-endopeptidase MepM/ murein hydrolase activator NlpD